MVKTVMRTVGHLPCGLRCDVARSAYRRLSRPDEVIVWMVNAVTLMTGHATWQLQLCESLLVRALFEKLSLQHVTGGANVCNSRYPRRCGSVTSMAGRACWCAQVAGLDQSFVMDTVDVTGKLIGG